jgi:hypothetical protein
MVDNYVAHFSTREAVQPPWVDVDTGGDWEFYVRSCARNVMPRAVFDYAHHVDYNPDYEEYDRSIQPCAAWEHAADAVADPLIRAHADLVSTVVPGAGPLEILIGVWCRVTRTNLTAAAGWGDTARDIRLFNFDGFTLSGNSWDMTFETNDAWVCVNYGTS